MARGPSGRMVVEIQPELKRRLYAELIQEGLTFKEWLTGQVERYVADRRQPLLFVAESGGQTYGPRGSR